MSNNNSDNSIFFNSTNFNNQEFNTNNNNNNNNIFITITNANSLKDKTKELERLLSQYYDKLTINVFTETCLQLKLSDNYLGRKWVHGLTTAEDRNGGVSICYHAALGDATTLNIFDKKLSNRLLPVKFSPPQHSEFVVVAVYIPASLQDRDKGVFLSSVLAETNALKLIYPNLILAGDFNTLLLSETNNMYQGFTTQSLNRNRCPGILEEWMTLNQFCHPFQRLRKFPYEKYLTFGFDNMAKGIDHFFVSKESTKNIVNLTISDEVFAQSRHKSITLELSNMMENPIGVKSNYRIPAFVWTIPWFKNETEVKISSLLNDFSNLNYDRFVSDTICKASKIGRNLRKDLFLKLSMTTNREDMNLIKSKIFLLSVSRARNWNREISNCIAEIDGTSSNAEMAEKAVQYYSTLYSEDLKIDDNDEINNFLKNCNMKQLSEEKKLLLNKPFTEVEFEAVINKSTTSKSIGPDCISNELLNFAGFSKLLVIISNNIMNGGTVPSSLSKTYLRLVHKNNSRTQLSNYRPIGITSLAYKTIASVIVSRISILLPELIGSHQQGYIRNRGITQHSRAVQEMLFQCITQNDNCVTFKTDFEQAFDNLSNRYLKLLLKFLNFGDNIIRLIMTLNTSLVGLIIMNNSYSNEFNIMKGVVQGSPLSALIFIIGLEPLLTTAINNIKYGFFKISSAKKSVLGYCDDLFILTDRYGIICWMNLLVKWRTIAGEKLKVVKCLLNILGDHNPDIVTSVTNTLVGNFQQNGEQWNIKSNEKFKLLGTKYDPIYNGEPLVSFTNDTWRLPSSKLNFAFSIFHGSTNIFDRIIQAKIKLISLFISTEASAPSDATQQKQIQSVIYAATLSTGSYKIPKIRSTINALPVAHGGLAIPLYSAIASAICLKDLLRQFEESPSWQSDLIKRSIIACFISNANFNNEIRALPIAKIAIAPIDYLLCLPIRYDSKCVSKLADVIPKSAFNALALFSSIDKKIIFKINDLAPVYSKSPTSFETSIARSLLNQPIFMNHLFLGSDNKRLRASVLCEHFFTLADIWSFEQSNIDYSLLRRAKANVEMNGHPLTTDELALFPTSASDLQCVWLKILTPDLINFIKWAKPVLHGASVDNGGTTFMLNLASFDNPRDIAPFKVDRVYSFSVTSKITVAMLTKHFTVTHCTNNVSTALNFPGINKWTANHHCLNNHIWTDTFKLLSDKLISSVGRDALMKIIHRSFVPTATRAITLNYRPYMPCNSCSEVCMVNPPLYDHEHALLLCPVVMNLWTIIRKIIIHIAGGCFISDNGSLSLISIFTLGTCNVNIEHNNYKPLMLTSVRNVMGLALAVITSASTKRNLENLKSNFSKLLGDYLYNASLYISKTSVLDLQVFLKLWNPIFTKIHHGEIFHVDDYKYNPVYFSLGGIL